MNKQVKFASILSATLGIFLGTTFLSVTNAQAQEITVREEPGVAIPLTAPQSQHFAVGGDVAVKLDINVLPWLDLGPTISYLDLPSHNTLAVPSGSAWSFGGMARIKRPHDAVNNTGSGFSAVSPWLDAEGTLVETGPLSRFGWSIGLGASVPTTDSRSLWIGPFVRYQGVLQNNDPGFDDRDAKTLIAGVSFEFGGGVKPKKEVEYVDVPASPCPTCPPPALPVVSAALVKLELQETIHFAWDSSKLDTNAKTLLDGDAAKIIAATPQYKTIRVEGHASSDGQVAHNNTLSQKRAEAVMNYLIFKGISKDRLTAVGFGSTMPLSDNKTQTGRENNRRVEFVVHFVMEQGASK